MKLKRLTLANFRIFEQATFDFQPGMNLLVGINGTGKSSVLDALRMVLSACVGLKHIPFVADDLTVGCDNLTCEMRFTNESLYTFRGERRPLSNVGFPGVERISSGWSQETYERMKSVPEPPVVVYFSPLRAFLADVDHHALPNLDSPGKQQAAYAGALLPSRKLQARKFAEWMRMQNLRSRSDADPIATRRLRALQETVSQFLENYTRIEDGPRSTPTLLDQDENPLNIKQLSDGERDLLALIFDLMYYLSLANPKLEDPLRDGEAVVLIDELDLHLHPRWQRTIIEKLTTTFPNCQFIATTHSPQIIGECDPAGLILLTKEDGRVVVTQGGHQGFGLDSSWILEHLMGTAPRNVSVQRRINRVEDAIEEGNLPLARKQLADLRQTLHGDDDEVVRLEASINNLEALADEVDSETP